MLEEKRKYQSRIFVSFFVGSIFEDKSKAGMNIFF